MYVCIYEYVYIEILEVETKIIVVFFLLTLAFRPVIFPLGTALAVSHVHLKLLFLNSYRLRKLQKCRKPKGKTNQTTKPTNEFSKVV